MEYNKRQFQKANDKKTLHKVRKQWVVVSLALLMAIGGKAAVTHVNAKADANNNGNLMNEGQSIKDQLNQKLVQTQKPNSQLQTQTNHDNSQTTPSRNLNINQINQQSRNLYRNIMQHGIIQSLNHGQTNQNGASQTNDQTHSSTPNRIPASAPINKTAKPNAAYENYLKKMGDGKVYNHLIESEINQQKDTTLIKSKSKRQLLDDGFQTGTYMGLNYAYDPSSQSLYFTGGTPNPDLSHLVSNGAPYPTSSITLVGISSDIDFSHVTNMTGMFKGDPKLEFINLPNNFNTSRVTSMNSMFENDPQLGGLQLPNSFNTHNVTNMGAMFSSDGDLMILTLPNSFDTSNVTTMAAMFSNDSVLPALNLPSSFNTSKVTNMAGMFMFDSGLRNLTLPSVFNTSNVKDMTGMFALDTNLSDLTLPESFDTSDVTSMYMMFAETSSLHSLTLPSSFNTSNVGNMREIFADGGLNTITLGSPNDLTGFVNTKTDSPAWLNKAYQKDAHDNYTAFMPTNLLDGNSHVGTFKATATINPNSLIYSDIYSNVDGGTAPKSMSSNWAYVNQQGLPVSNPVMDSKGHIMVAPKYEGMTYKYDKNNNSVEFTGGVANNLNSLSSLSRYPQYGAKVNLRSVKTIIFDSDVDTSRVTRMNGMFYYDRNLQNIRFSNSFNTSNVTDMAYMFCNDVSLQSIQFPKSFNTHRVTNMNEMFFGDSDLQSLNLGDNFDTRNVTNMSDMFGNNTNLQTIILSNSFDTHKVTNMSDMFGLDFNLKSINLGDNFDTRNVTNMNGMFSSDGNLTSDGKLNSLTIQSPNTILKNSSVPEMYKKDESDDYTSIDPVKLSDGNSHVGTFLAKARPKFKTDTIIYHDIYGDHDGMNTPANKTVNDEGYDRGNLPTTYNVTNNDIPAGYTLVDGNGNVINPNQDDFDFDNGTHTFNIAPVYKGLTYDYNQSDDSLTFVSGTLTWNSTGTYFMIGITNLGITPKVINFGDRVNTGNLTNASSMFNEDPDLQSINLGNNFNTRNVTNMSNMFGSDYTLQHIDLGNSFNTQNVTSMNGMFDKDPKLQSINLGNNFNTQKVSDMSDMFASDLNLSQINSTQPDTADLSIFNTNSLKSYTNMLYRCSSLKTVDLAGWKLNGNGTGIVLSDNNLNKLILGSGTNVSNDALNDNDNFFKNNVNSNGLWSTSDLKNGTQKSDAYYAAKPVNINWVYPGSHVVSTGKTIGVPLSPDADYHGNVKSQIASVGVVDPVAYSRSSNNSYAIQNPNSSNPYININLVPEQVTVPVQFINNADGHHDVVYSYQTAKTTANHSVNINTELPQGYSWNQAMPSNMITVKIGNQPGQISNNSGQTNPVKLYVKGNSVTIPINYINQENDVAASTFISTNVDSDVNWPTQTGLNGVVLDPNQVIQSRVVGTYTNNGDNNYLNNNLNTNYVHLDPNKPGYTQPHYMNVSSAATSVMATVTIVKQSPTKTAYGYTKIPVEGHVDDSYTISDSDFNVPDGYSLNTPNNTYTVKLTAPGQYQWQSTNNPWDGQNNRPKVIYTADQAGTINVRYLNQHDQEVGNETALTGKVGATDDLSQVSIPNGYTYDAYRMPQPNVTFTDQPQTFTVYVTGNQFNNIPVKYSAPGLQGNAVNDGSVSGRVGDTEVLPTNHLPNGYVISSDQGLIANHHGGNLNYVIQPANSTQYVDLKSRTLTVPVQFKDVSSNANVNDQLLEPVNYSTQGTLNNSVNLPSAPKYYQYASGQSNTYKLTPDQIDSNNNNRINQVTVKVVGKPTVTNVSYVDPQNGSIKTYDVDGSMGDVINLHAAPQGYALDNSSDAEYTPLPSDVNDTQSTGSKKIQMNNLVVPIHAQYHKGIRKNLLIKYEDANGNVQSQANKSIVLNGYTGDKYTFNPQDLNVPQGYLLSTTNLDRAQINPDGSATWLTDSAHDDPSVIFKANQINTNLHIIQIEELPDHAVVGTHSIDYPISGFVGQTYSVADNKITSPQNYHLFNGQQMMQGTITANGLTNNNVMLDYVKDPAQDIDVHYRIHGHNSDVGNYDYNGTDDNDAYIGERINGLDHIPSGYCLDTDNTSADTEFTFSNESQNDTIYVRPSVLSQDAVKVNVVLQDNQGNPINDPNVPVIDNTKGHVMKGYQVLVPVKPGPGENFTVTPSDAQLMLYTKGFTAYHNSDITGIQKANGLDITSKNKNTFIYRANTDPTDAGTLTIKYINQNGQIVNNSTNNQSSYAVPNGYRNRYVSDVTKLAGVPKGYQLLNTDKRDYIFNGIPQTVILVVNGKTFNDKVHVFKVEEDPNDQSSRMTSDYYSLPDARVGNSYTVSAVDYLPNDYNEDTSNNLDQPVTFTVQSDGTLNNGAAAKFYYRSNADRYLADLKDIDVNYRAHYQDGSSRLVSDDRLSKGGLINPIQIPDPYDGRTVSDVTKYVPVPAGYQLDTDPRQDLQATMSITREPQITLNVTPTNSTQHDSDNNKNAQPIFMAFENNTGQIIDEAGDVIGTNGRVDAVDKESRLDGAMGAKIQPLSTYPIPVGYHLASNQMPSYEISNQIQHKLISIVPNPDSTRDYHLTIRTVTPSDKPLDTIHSDVKIPVKISQTVNIDPAMYNPNHAYYQLDGNDSTDNGNISINNINENLNQKSGTLTYKAILDNNVGTLIVDYYSGSQFINRGVIHGQYAQQRFTTNDVVNAVKPEAGFEVNSNQNHVYVIGDSGSQDVNLYVHGEANNPESINNSAMITIIKEDSGGNKISSDVVPYSINENVGNDYVIDPNEFIPDGFKLDTRHPNHDAAVSGEVQSNGLSNDKATFYYQSTKQAAPIYVKYINQVGSQVGTVNALNGNYGHTINDVTNQNDGGVNIPKGYQLTPNLNQLTKYTFGNQPQYIDLFITGQPVTNQYTVHVVKHNGFDPQSTQNITRTYSGRVGDQINVDPADYVPSNYQMSNEDHDQFITATVNDQAAPSTTTFVYNEQPVTGQIVYKDDQTNEVIAQQSVTNVAGTQMSLLYSDYKTYLPYGYQYDHIDNQNASKLENDNQYVIYLKKLSTKSSTTPANNPLSYIDVEYKDVTNGKVINLIKVAGKDGQSFDVNDYVKSLPFGYKSIQLDNNSSKPSQFKNGVEPTVIVDLKENGFNIKSDVTDTINYVDPNGHVVNSRHVRGLRGNSIDWPQYAGYVPSGYVYDYMGNYEMNLSGQTNVIHIQPDTPQIQYGTVNVNYIDASDGHSILTNTIYGIAGSTFDSAKFETEMPSYSDDTGWHSYRFLNATGDVMAFNTGNQSITVRVHKAPKPAPEFGTITVDYIDSRTNKKLNGSVTISGRVDDIFDPGVFENNLPSDYSFVSVKNPLYNFTAAPQTMVIKVDRDG